jgi:glycosyltransferase involved in cell wall biosynthesis
MKVNVPMITYNHARLLAQALESVLAQRVSFDHQIVVGEEDGTKSLAS